MGNALPPPATALEAAVDAARYAHAAKQATLRAYVRDWRHS